jgi:hypothetical protein
VNTRSNGSVDVRDVGITQMTMEVNRVIGMSLANISTIKSPTSDHLADIQYQDLH